MTATEERDFLYRQHLGRLEQMAHNALAKGYDAQSVVMVLIDVDDQTWADLAEYLVPNSDWQAYRDRGEKPVARGSVLSDIRELVSEIVPDVKDALDQEIPEGMFQAIVLGSGGASVYYIEPAA